MHYWSEENTIKNNFNYNNGLDTPKLLMKYNKNTSNLINNRYKNIDIKYRKLILNI